MIKVRPYTFNPNRVPIAPGLLEAGSLPSELRPDPTPVVVPNRRDRRRQKHGFGGRR